MKPISAVRVISAANSSASVKDVQLRECMANPTYECVIAAALSIAQGVEDAHDRANVLRDIAVAQAEAGEMQSAHDTFVAAFSAVQCMDKENPHNVEYTDTLCTIVSAQVGTGDTNGALESARSVDGADRVNALRAIALAKVKSGKFDDAYVIAQDIDDASSCAGVLCEIAEAQMKAGDVRAARKSFSDAFSMAQLIDGGGICGEMSRAGSLLNITVARVRAGDGQNAREAYAAVVFNAQEVARAVDATQKNSLIKEHNRAAQTCLSAKFVASNVYRRPLCDPTYMLEKIEDSFRDIALAQAEKGSIAAAYSTLRSIGSVELKAEVLSAIVRAQARMKDFAAALSVARNISIAHIRADALLHIALGQAEAGDIQSMRNTIAAALSATRNIKYEQDRDRVLFTISSALKDVGDYAAAISVAQDISDRYSMGGICAGKTNSLLDIALEQAKSRDGQAARETMIAALAACPDASQGTVVGDAHISCRVIAGGIAAAQAKSEDIVAALSVTRECEHEQDIQGSASRIVAEAWAKIGEFQGAVKIAMDAKDAHIRAGALADIAKHMAARESN